MSVRAHMAIHHPPHHLLRTASYIGQAVRQILAAAAIFTRSPEVNPILEEATLLQIRNIRIGTSLDTTSTIIGIKFLLGALLLPAIVVSSACNFVLSLYIELFVGPRTCRFHGCNNPVLFDRRINELREWCGDRHMQYVVRIYLYNPVSSYLLLAKR